MNMNIVNEMIISNSNDPRYREALNLANPETKKFIN